MNALSVIVLSGTLKAAIVLMLGLLFDAALRRQSAALRHRVWTAAFVAVVMLPLLGVVAPPWHVAMLPRPPVAEPAAQLLAVTSTDVVIDQDAAIDRSAAIGEGAGDRTGAADLAAGTAAAPPGRPETRGLPWGRIALAAWLTGVGLLLLQLGLAAWRARSLCASAADVDDPAWRTAFDRARRRLGITRPVRLVRSNGVSMPMAWGVHRHCVVLPPRSDEWSEERREVVLLHELAHVQRGDCVANLISALGAALHWFNPLVWIARRRLTAERELACDDAVLSSGASGADYAWHLLEIARASGRGPRLVPAGVMMARTSQLEGRLLAVLDGSRNRTHVSRVASLAVTLACCLVAFGLAGLQPWSAAQAQTAEAERREPAPAPQVQPEPQAAVQPQAQPAMQPEAQPEPRPTPTPEPQQSEARERVMQMMIGLLTDSDVQLRSQAAQSLGNIEDARAVDGLSNALLNDDSAQVRSQAAWALGMIESRNAVAALSQSLAGETSAEVRSQAAWALGMIESPDGVPGLLVALRDSESQVRSQAAWALGMIESGDAVDGLVQVLQTDSSMDVRSQAAWALGMIEDERAVEALIQAVEDGNEQVRKQALWAISMIVG